MAEEGLGFEEALTRLEEIVHRLEGGDLSLDESLNLFEEGMRLSKLCSMRLNEARTRIEILIKDEEGRPILKPFLEEELTKNSGD